MEPTAGVPLTYCSTDSKGLGGTKTRANLEVWIFKNVRVWPQCLFDLDNHNSIILEEGNSQAMVRTMLPRQGAWVGSLVGELRSHMPRGTAKKKKKPKIIILEVSSLMLELFLKTDTFRMYQSSMAL